MKRKTIGLDPGYLEGVGKLLGCLRTEPLTRTGRVADRTWLVELGGEDVITALNPVGKMISISLSR